MALRIQSDLVTPLQVNAYLLFDDETRDGVLIDPGEFSQFLDDIIRAQGINIRYILNTHGHFDHIGGNVRSAEAYSAPIVCHEIEAPLLEDPVKNGSTTFGVATESSRASLLVKEGDLIEAGSLEIKVIHTPGHTPGGVCYLAGDHLFAGDTLFAGSIGNYEFPGGSRSDLMTSIREKLFTLPGETNVYPGHGPATTIDREAHTNPFFIS